MKAKFTTVLFAQNSFQVKSSRFPTGTRYYKYNSHKGLRYFKVNWDGQKVTQNVVAQKGKRGRPNMKGVYEISWTTWMTNYCHYTVWETMKETTEKVWSAFIGKTLQIIGA